MKKLQPELKHACKICNNSFHLKKHAVNCCKEKELNK